MNDDFFFSLLTKMNGWDIKPISFYLFLTLKWGMSLFYTPQYQYFKAVSYVLFSHFECLPVFYSEAALPIELSVFWDNFVYLSKRCRYYCWFKSKLVHTIRHRFVCFSFLKSYAHVLKEGTWLCSPSKAVDFLWIVSSLPWQATVLVDQLQQWS